MILPMKITHILYLVVLFAVMVFGSSRVAAQEIPATGEDLLANCEASGKPPCMWYIKGLIDGMMTNPGSVNIQTSCLPDRFNFDQMRRVVVKWLSDHPEKLHLGVAQLVRDALRDAFPCKK